MIDLHTHSTASDGTCSPGELIDLAAQRGISALALTDHDTLSGLEAAQDRARTAGIRFIPGVEIEIESLRGEFHLLGLGLSGDRSRLADALQEVRRRRHERNLVMIGKLRNAGFDISLEELSAAAGGEVVSRAHFARLLMAKKYVSSIEKAFKRYLGKGQPFYEARKCLSLSEAVSIIRGAGGISVIAHPLSLQMRGPALRQFLEHCRGMGVAGIEAYHPTHPLKDARRLERLGRRLDLLITGGSDFHGSAIPQRRLGYTSGGLPIPDALLDALRLDPS
jgi:predicted metal-dependent phosphoesterase TrpH